MQKIRNDLPQKPLRIVQKIYKRLQVYVNKAGGQWTYSYDRHYIPSQWW